MKKFITGTAISVLSLLAARCGAMFPQIAGPATFNMSAIVTNTLFHLVNSTTNVTGGTTNEMYLSTASTTTTHFTSSNLLALIEHSFGTNFPAGSQIGVQFGNIVILITNGTFVRLDTVLNISFDTPGRLVSGSQTFVVTSNTNGTSSSTGFSETDTASITYTYDDTGLVSTNQTKFQLKGLMVEKETLNLKSHLEKVTYEFQGTGGGPVQGVPTILTGTISSKASGVLPPP